MKKRFFLRWCLITLTIIFILSGCDLAFNEPQILTGTVTITGPNPPKVGDVLTAAYTGGNGKGTATWQWLCGNDVIGGAAGNTYTIISADVGGTIKARVSYTNNSGSVTSTATGVVYSPAIVAVSDITGVPTVGTAGTPLSLTGTVAPANATNKTIVWSVKNPGTTGGSIVSGSNSLTTTAAGPVVVTATIANGLALGTNYTKDFTITIGSFVEVTNITGVPTTGTVGTALSLSEAAVAPANATNKTITWSIKNAGTTGAIISNGNRTLYNTAAGTVVVTATIENGKSAGTAYTQDFTITIGSFVPVTNITGVPTTGTALTPLTLNATVSPGNATNKSIIWSVKNSQTGVSISGNVLNATDGGTIAVTATVLNGKADGNYTQDFTITIASFTKVTNITGVPSTGLVGPLSLSGATVEPNTANYKAITWSVSSPGATGATITGSTLTTAAPGTVGVTATVSHGLGVGTNYTQVFNITINPFVAVTDVTGVPTTGTVGTALTLSGAMVAPADATNKIITWSLISFRPSGTISGTGTKVELKSENNTTTITAAVAGEVVVTATIADGKTPGVNFSKNFTIMFN